MNEGIDTVLAAADYALSGGSAVEQLRGSAGATGLKLTGNAFDNTLLGGSGDDTLNGGAGADVLRGRLGDDSYLVDDAGDAVVEKSGQGNDTVSTTLSSLDLGASVEISGMRAAAISPGKVTRSPMRFLAGQATIP